MPYSANVLTVLIASPGDTLEARDVVETAIRQWNADQAIRSKVILLPLRWERDSVPLLGRGDAQEVINGQIVELADIVIGLFHSRLGSATARAPSGTAEEIQRSVDKGSLVHVYFSTQPHPPDVDTVQLNALREFHDSLNLRGAGLTGNYSSTPDLSAKVRHALDSDVARIRPTDITNGSAGPNAILRARLEYDTAKTTSPSGKAQPRRIHHRIVVDNTGSAAAEDVGISITAEGSGTEPRLKPRSSTTTINPSSFAIFPVLASAGVASHWIVNINWQEGTAPYSERQLVMAT